jgi:glycosyltransferase involved in cell wall biosynthesis
VSVIPNGCDFDDFAGLDYRPDGRFRITHTGSFFGKRDPKPFLRAVHDSGLEVGGRGRGVVSGKLFEYLAAARPILAAVPPDGAAAELIRETGAGVVAAPDDPEALREALAGLHERFRSGGLPDVQLDPGDRERLSRRARVEETADLLRSLA